MSSACRRRPGCSRREASRAGGPAAAARRLQPCGCRRAAAEGHDPAAAAEWQNRSMPVISRRVPPPGVLLFLGYGFLLLASIGVSLRWVVDMAIDAPVSLPGLVVMILLAYTIFTIVMVKIV